MTRPVLLIACLGVEIEPWLNGLSKADPHVELRVWPDIGDATEIEWVLAWNPPAELWSNLPNLKAIFSLGAGVDKFLSAGGLPENVPVVRMVDPSLVSSMTEYVLMRVLHYHRMMPQLESQQARREWRKVVAPLAGERRVGVMGLGQLGGACARALVQLGFQVSGWSRSRKQIDGVKCFAGVDRLGAFAARCEILVCLLPLTALTEGVLNAGFFASMPAGASLINVSRGGSVVDEDLLIALDSGHLSAATLDVFKVEPLPEDHPYWTHPKVTVTPHISALTNPFTASRVLMDNLRGHLNGEPLRDVVDRALGY